jgi:Zn-dependent peptidase ImmA (M78 family)
MKSEPIPVNPELITWARVRAGFSLADMESKFKRIAAWERGESSPSYPQLERMATEFKIPVAVFFFPEPPEVPDIEKSFRTLPEQEFALLPRRIRTLVRKASAFQISLYELTGGKNPAPRLLLRDISVEPESSVAEIASTVREYLGISIDAQKAWPTVEDALGQWRQVFADVGIAVFKDSFREEGYSGFCLYDEEFPLIYVNNTTAKTRQIFTLFHELAHLFFGTSGIDAIKDDFIKRLPRNDQRIEVACNRFAAEFLFPQSLFETEMERREPSESTVEQLADLYKVSREFVLRRLMDKGLVSQEEYESLSETWAAQKGAGSGGNWYHSQIVYLGRAYIDLAFRNFYQNKITESQLADYLNIKPKNLGQLEEHFMRGAS